MDILPVHNVAGVREVIEAAGAKLRYLPKYSPDLNPIEGDQFGVLLAIENSGHRRRRSLLVVQHSRKALLHQLLATR